MDWSDWAVETINAHRTEAIAGDDWLDSTTVGGFPIEAEYLAVLSLLRFSIGQH